jgi:hypothetical protein
MFRYKYQQIIGLNMDLIQLTEEPNSSLMFHKLFPNRRLLRDLESRGYEFVMGDGLKLQRQYFSSQHRANSGPKRQRMIQTLIIFKKGKFFRKIPKSSWVQLVDPSDGESKTFGEVFMKKLLQKELDAYTAREKGIIDKNS